MRTRDSGRRLVSASLALGIALALPLGGIAAANHGSRTLQVAPETANRPLGASHTLTATVSSAATVASGTINVDFENEGGVNDADGVTRTTPDLTCSIPAGQASCTVSYSGATAGRDVWRVWIDHDGLDTSVEADTTEGRNETANPGGGGTNCPGAGAGGEPDCTDVVEALWGTGTLDCDDAGGANTERNTNPAGGGAVSNERYTCTLTDATGRPATGATINAEVENEVNDPDAVDGPSYDSPDYTCTTGTGASGTTAGVCVVTVTQNENETGTAQICFWQGTAADAQALCADEPTDENQEADGSDAGNDLADRVEKTWEVRTAAEGGIDAEAETVTNRLGDQHSITVTVYDQFGTPFAGSTAVAFEFFAGSPSDLDGNTPESPDNQCNTAGATTCSVTYRQADTPGTDLICVWMNATPEMSGTNNSGTCDAEGRDDADDRAATADAPVPRNDDVDVVQKIWQFPTSAARLDCTPETAKNRRNTSHEITCTATDAAGIPVARAEIDAEAVVANDPDAADSPTAPDFSCVTRTDGTCTVVHGPAGLGASEDRGDSVYRVWIDADNDNSTVEADVTEGRDETTTAGATEPDITDVVSKTWTQIRCDVVGTDGDETLVGTDDDDVICGFGGDDILIGGEGRDHLLGDEGRDTIRAGSGHDLVEGGSGHDTLEGARGHDTLKGGPGNDRLRGGRGKDRCSGGAGRDTATGC